MTETYVKEEGGPTSNRSGIDQAAIASSAPNAFPFTIPSPVAQLYTNSPGVTTGSLTG